MPSRSPGSARVNRHHAPRRHGRRFHSGDNVKAKIQDEEGIFVGPATSEFDRQASRGRQDLVGIATSTASRARDDMQTRVKTLTAR